MEIRKELLEQYLPKGRPVDYYGGGLVHRGIPIEVDISLINAHYIGKCVALYGNLRYTMEIRHVIPNSHACVLICRKGESITSIEVMFWTECDALPKELKEYLLHDAFRLEESDKVEYVPLRVTVINARSRVRHLWGCMDDIVYGSVIDDELLDYMAS